MHKIQEYCAGRRRNVCFYSSLILLFVVAYATLHILVFSHQDSINCTWTQVDLPFNVSLPLCIPQEAAGLWVEERFERVNTTTTIRGKDRLDREVEE